jgi:endoglucanase
VLVTLVCLGVTVPGCLVLPRIDTRPLLVATWQTYKRDFIRSDGQVLNPIEHRGWFHSEHVRYTQTTSEGQAYAMLRAVWLGDRDTFDRVWQWASEHLQVRQDRLLGWLWAPDENDTWRLLDDNSATDADEDFALALIFAAHRWHDDRYLAAARASIGDIWRLEVAEEGGRYYLTAGTWGPQYEAGLVLDPSYLAPYEYRIFAREDPDHPWAALADDSYHALRACSWARLGGRRATGLPPNWCVIRRSDGVAAPFSGLEVDDYGYDAFRVMWRVAVDAIWYGSAAARRYLQDSDYLRSQWTQRGWLAAQYRHDGTLMRRPWQDPSAYAADVGNFMVTDAGDARSILQSKLIDSYHSANGVAYWGDRWNYYEQNWVWFGVALAGGELPNLAEQGDPRAGRPSR